MSEESMQDFLRGWRHDALQKHQYEAAIYVGDKLLAITSQFAQPAIRGVYGSDTMQMIPMMLSSSLKSNFRPGIILAP